MNFLFVALGGAPGAMARYAISIILVKSTFPRRKTGMVDFAKAKAELARYKNLIMNR